MTCWWQINCVVYQEATNFRWSGGDIVKNELNGSFEFESLPYIITVVKSHISAAKSMEA